ncbi:hypothetical protein ACHAWF_006731 [Thalassiosira exigua]
MVDDGGSPTRCCAKHRKVCGGLCCLFVLAVAGSLAYVFTRDTNVTHDISNATAYEMCASDHGNERCSPFEPSSSQCGGSSCSDHLECAWETGRCASTPRKYGEPCGASTGGEGYCGPGLRCSTSCGICFDEVEEEINPESFMAAVVEETQAEKTATACGMSSDRSFRTWAGTIRTVHPLLMPKDDDELRSILEKAREGGCRVRPAGSGHSAPGVVAEESLEGDVVAVSLADYASSDPEWASITIADDEAEKTTVRVPAGATQLDLYAVIRPKNYFLKTQTAGWLFSIAGIVSNFVHGGAFGEGPVHDSVRSLRVIYANGTAAVISDQGDLKRWRNGYGLLGFITGVELEVVKRQDFWFRTLPARTLNGGWNSASFDSYVQDVKASYTAALFFLNPNTKEVVAFKFGDGRLSQSCRLTERPPPTTDEDCAWDYKLSVCRNLDQCSYQFQLGDGHLDQSCRLIDPRPPDASSVAASYRQLIADNPQLGVDGVTVGDDKLQRAAICLASRAGLEKLLVKLVMDEIPRLVRKAKARTNDGFFVGDPLPLSPAYMTYIVRAEKLFRVLDEITKLEYILSAPMDWRYIMLSEGATTLRPGDLTPGEYAAVEISTMEIPGRTPDEWRDQFLDIERILREAGGIPHTGKYFGMGTDANGVIRPFQDVGLEDIYSNAQKREFGEYAFLVDPKGLFRSGFMADHIGLDSLVVAEPL